MLVFLLACKVPELIGGEEKPSTREPMDYDVFVNGFHTVSGDPATQMAADHYCENRANGLIACVLYDPDGRLMGIEHIVARDVFNGFSPDEKTLWHPHDYEVLAGLLIAPDLGGAAELELMNQLVSTYGKTWHVTEDGVYLGPALLMKAFTEDGQIDPLLVEARDRRFGVDTAAIRASRSDIEDPGFDAIVLQEPVFGICPTEPTP